MKTRLSAPLLIAATLLPAACITPSLQSGVQTPALLRQQTAGPAIDDSELSAPMRAGLVTALEREGRREGSQLIFKAVPLNRQAMRPLPANRLELQGKFSYYTLSGQLAPGANATVSLYQGSRKVSQVLTGPDGSWRLTAPAPGGYQLRYTLANPRWNIDRYSWEGPEFQVQGALDTGTYTLEKGSQNAEAAYIHDVYNQALTLFEREQNTLNWGCR